MEFDAQECWVKIELIGFIEDNCHDSIWLYLLILKDFKFLQAIISDLPSRYRLVHKRNKTRFNAKEVY